MPADEPYRAFAKVYDRVMSDVPYDEWVDYLVGIFRRFRIRPQDILEIACGTGNVLVPLAQRGYHVAGLDRSADMLAVCRAKIEKADLRIPLWQQDMRTMSLPETFDVILCLYDSINYVLEADELSAVFQRVREHLRPGGYFIFDMNSSHRLAKIPNDTIVIDEPGFFLCWENNYDGVTRIWSITLNGFVEDENNPGVWHRFHELHQERGYPHRLVLDLLRKAGLVSRAEFTAFTFLPVTRHAGRIYYVAQRPV